jgi:hypothetical protein
MSDPVDLDALCTDLLELIPHLVPALTRDNTPGNTRTTLNTAVPFNLDVVTAGLMLVREIPATRAQACALTGEPCPRRPVTTCLRALPRLASRLHDLNQVAARQRIERDVQRWTRTVKFALGLRTPDRPIGWNCPSALHAIDYPDQPCQLVAIGSEGFLRPDHTVYWQHAAIIWCAVCGATWPEMQWNQLGKVLESA